MLLYIVVVLNTNYHIYDTILIHTLQYICIKNLTFKGYANTQNQYEDFKFLKSSYDIDSKTANQ